jgi:hypothetical protein
MLGHVHGGEVIAGAVGGAMEGNICIHASVAMAVVIAIPTPKGIMGVEVAVHGGDREI